MDLALSFFPSASTYVYWIPIPGLDHIVRHRRRNRRSGAAGATAACPELADPNLTSEIVGNDTGSGGGGEGGHKVGAPYPLGTVLKVKCAKGFELHPPKKRIKCGRRSGNSTHLPSHL